VHAYEQICARRTKSFQFGNRPPGLSDVGRCISPTRRRLGIARDVASGWAGDHTAFWTSRTSLSVTVYLFLVARVYELHISLTFDEEVDAKTSRA
jgi:hypothetical protein